MKAWKVLAVVLTSLLFPGCVSKEKAMEPVGAASPRQAQSDPAEERLVTVAHLLEAHHEAVGQIRVSAALRPQHRVDCN
jgi:outer membrane murein-binding lipoprotein Lpp